MGVSRGTNSGSPSSGSQGRVLVVHQDAPTRQTWVDALRHAGNQSEGCGSAVEALALVANIGFDVVVLSLGSPPSAGIELCQQLRRRFEGLQLAVSIGREDLATAAKSLRQEAFDYLPEPCDPKRLVRLVARALAHGQLLARHTAVPASSVDDELALLLGTSRLVQTMRERIDRAAQKTAPLLVTGECGTLKHRVASAVHAASPRSAGPLAHVHCKALSGATLEAELFGSGTCYAASNFSEESSRVGRCEVADGGTLVLEEVCELDRPTQARLLDMIHLGVLERSDGRGRSAIDARIIATSTRDLRKEVAAGRFRAELYYQLAIVPLVVPSLRERPEDIAHLIRHFLARAAARLDAPPAALAADVFEMLVAYHWPGNHRELNNTLTWTSVTQRGEPLAHDEVCAWLIDGTRSHRPRLRLAGLPADCTGEFAGPDPSTAAVLSLREMESKLIAATLERFGGQRVATARALGIDLHTLAVKLNHYAGRGRRLVLAA